MKDIEAWRFRVTAPQAALDDLAQRLARTRLPAREPAEAAWKNGTSLAYMRELIAYWRDQYNWRCQEAWINRFAGYRLPAGDLNVHVIVEPGSGPNPLPLVLTHGWPGSMVEFLGLVEALAHPERFGGNARDAFTVVVPSLPGYGWSDAPEVPISPRQVAGMWHELMRNTLGFERYVAHGGDWGAAITSWLAFDHPGDLAAIHLTLGLLTRPLAPGDRPLDAEEAAHLDLKARRMSGETGYSSIQGTKPQSLAYGLTDSPAGLAGWVLEKYQGWSAARGRDASPPMDVDRLITLLMFYWLNEPGASYWMYRYIVDGSGFTLPPGPRIETPSHFCLFPDDISLPAPRQFIERTYNVVEYGVAPFGGHFPGLDATDVLAKSLRSAFQRYR
jgi:microsomal epoxide hydrolase